MPIIDWPDCIQDNIHRRVQLTPLERQLISTATFRRLGRISQLGLASMLFPGATHTRFAHSLGVLHIMNRILDRLGIGVDNPDDPERKKLRVAALLHDVGQYPLSHAVEFTYRVLDSHLAPQEVFENVDVAVDDRNILQTVARSTAEQNFNDDAKDKKMAAFVIFNSTDILTVLRENGLSDTDIDEIAAIISGETTNKLHKQLMDSDYDCDRLDYVMRDGAMTGVSYGAYDLDYLIENMLLRRHTPTNPECIMALHKRRAVHALEHYLTGRYLMYSQIVHHKTIKTLELMAKAICFALAQEGMMYRNAKEIVRAIPSGEFLFFDDTYFFSKMAEYKRKQGGNEMIKTLIDRVMQGRPLTVVEECEELVDREKVETRDEKYMSIRQMWLNDTNRAEICRAANVEEKDVAVEEISVEFVPIGPRMLLEDVVRNRGIVPSEIEHAPRLYDEESDRVELLVQDRGSIIYQLARLRLDILRVYTTNDAKKDTMREEMRRRV